METGTAAALVTGWDYELMYRSTEGEVRGSMGSLWHVPATAAAVHARKKAGAAIERWRHGRLARAADVRI